MQQCYSCDQGRCKQQAELEAGDEQLSNTHQCSCRPPDHLECPKPNIHRMQEPATYCHLFKKTAMQTDETWYRKRATKQPHMANIPFVSGHKLHCTVSPVYMCRPLCYLACRVQQTHDADNRVVQAWNTKNRQGLNMPTLVHADVVCSGTCTVPRPQGLLAHTLTHNLKHS